jgi:hypothetical protein
MRPVEFKGCNVTLAENQPQYEPLPVMWLQDSAKTVIGCFELDDEDLIEVNRTKRLYIAQQTYGNPYHPINISPNLEDIVEVKTLKERVEAELEGFKELNPQFTASEILDNYNLLIAFGAYLNRANQDYKFIEIN